MDTFTTRNPSAVGSPRHHSAQGFCTVCGTVWPCWRAVREDSGHDAFAGAGPSAVAPALGRSW